MRPVRRYIQNIFSQYSALNNADVNVELRFHGIRVSISSNVNWNISDDDSMKWDYVVDFNDKNHTVEINTSCASYFQVTTPAQIEHLKQTAFVLEDLNKVDWASLLNITVPDYDTFIKSNQQPIDDSKEYDYDAELRDQILKDLIGKNKAIKIYEVRDITSRRQTSRYWYFAPTRETNKKFEGLLAMGKPTWDHSPDDIDDIKNHFNHLKSTGQYESIKKERIRIVEPEVIIDF